VSTLAYDLGPVWTTRDRVKAVMPAISGAAVGLVGRNDPGDVQEAADELIDACIVQAQQYIIGAYLRAHEDGPSGVATTFEETPGDLILAATNRTIVEVYMASTAHVLPPNVERRLESVDAWLEDLKDRHRFIATASPEDDGASSTPPKRAAPSGQARSAIGNAARRLLPVPGQADGGCW
jgi:hypothetical protein